MSRLWQELHARVVAERLGEGKPHSWPDYLATTGTRVRSVEIVALADFAGVREPGRIDGISDRLRWQIWERDNFTCLQCGVRRFLSVDHVYPKSKGGPTIPENLQTLCRDCNSKKGTRVIITMPKGKRG